MIRFLAAYFIMTASLLNAQDLIPGKWSVIVPEQSMGNVIAFYAESPNPAIITLQCSTHFPGLVFDISENAFRQSDPTIGPNDEVFVRLGTSDFELRIFDTSNPVEATNRNAQRWPGQNEMLGLIHAGVPMQVMIASNGSRATAREVFRFQYEPNQQDFELVLQACGGAATATTQEQLIPWESSRIVSGAWLLRPRGENFPVPIAVTDLTQDNGYFGLFCDGNGSPAGYIESQLKNDEQSTVVFSDGSVTHQLPASGYNSFAIFGVTQELLNALVNEKTLEGGVVGSYSISVRTSGAGRAISHALAACTVSR